MSKNDLLFILILLFVQTGLFAQDDIDFQKTHQIHIRKTTEKISIDGNLDETTWNQAEIATDFWEKWPLLNPHVKPQTEVKLTYDDNFLYIGITCIDTGDYVIKSLKRDVDYLESDGFFVVLDPINQRTNGFMFGINPLGVQIDALIAPSGKNPINSDWDAKWFAKTKNFTDRWTTEIAIPFKVLRYKENKTNWGINFIRGYPKGNHFHTWTPVPVQFWGVDLGFTGLLIWDKAPKRTKGNISLIPYIKGGLSKDYEEGTDPATSRNAGIDAKIAITSALNLDVTVNPDFSQIEVDEQVTDLSRFSIFFPEKRTFFLENSDIFSGFGISPIRPFFSRQIGLTDGMSVPILYGLRLTGNITNKLRIGALNTHTIKNEYSENAQNYTAFTFQKRIFDRSSIKGIFLNRTAFDKNFVIQNNYGRNAGLEFNYQSIDSKWRAWCGYHLSFKPDITNKNGFYSIGSQFNNKFWHILISGAGIGTNYYADMGFIRRIENYDAERDTTIRMGFHQMYDRFSYTLYPESKTINTHLFELIVFSVYNPDLTFNELNNTFNYIIHFKNSSFFRIKIEEYLVEAPFPFDFSFSEKPLPAERYHYMNFALKFNSDERKSFSYGAKFQAGTFYNGKQAQVKFNAAYRKQPWGSLGLAAEYNDITLSEDYGSGKLLLLQTKFEIDFSKNFFWTTFLQYNTQSEDFNINSRFQWQFAPLSNLYIVYTDNYGIPENNAFKFFSFPKNKAIVVKLNYWLAL